MPAAKRPHRPSKAEAPAGVAPPPKGREAATERILEAAERLFAEQPPSAVSTRAIAERAQVNLALIHRYVGSKDEVLKAVMRRYAQRFSQRFTRADDPREGVVDLFEDEKQHAFLRTLAFLVLSRHPLQPLITTGGALSAVIQAAEGDDDTERALRGLAGAALGMGWVLFEDFLLKASGSGLDPTHARQQIFGLAHQLLGRQTAAPADRRPAASRARARRR